MSDDDKPKLPHGADTLIPAGECENGWEHVVALKDGQAVAHTHMRRIVEGQSLPDHGGLFFVDTDTGRVLDSMRLGNGPAQVATPQYRENYDRIFGTEAN